MTARPTTPMLATAVSATPGPVGSGAGRETSSGAGAPSCSRAEPGWSSRSVEMFVGAEGSFDDTRTPEGREGEGSSLESGVLVLRGKCEILTTASAAL